MSQVLDSFKIVGLHDIKTIDLRFQDNRLVLVGENGSGKTTVLRLLFHFMSSQWFLLRNFHFNSIVANLGGEEIKLDHNELEFETNSENASFFRRLPASVRSRLQLALQEMRLGKVSSSRFYVEEVSKRYDVPLELVYESFHREENLFSDHLKKKIEQLETIMSSLTAKIVYLPTYRRIEEEFHLVFRDRNIKEAYEASRRPWRGEIGEGVIELFEFGMSDVDRAIKGVLSLLKESARKQLEELTLGYLGDILERTYDQIDLNKVTETDPMTIDRVLNRIDPLILTPQHKQHVRETVERVRNIKNSAKEHDKVICHYLLKLLSFQKELELREERITQFTKVCNRYLTPQQKCIDYDSSSFEVKIKDTSGNAILELQDLSSGEKQIVSFFSHLYLNWENSFFLIIDEPELSLSVPWQRNFLLDISNAERCSGFAAATHSTFIYDNSLEKYARGLGEFTFIEEKNG